MYSLPFSYSDSPLFKPNFCFVFHFEKVDQKIASVYHHQEIINIKNMIDLRKKDIFSYFEMLLNQIKPTVPIINIKQNRKVFWRKAQFLLLILTLSSKNNIVRSKLS